MLARTTSYFNHIYRLSIFNHISPLIRTEDGSTLQVRIAGCFEHHRATLTNSTLLVTIYYYHSVTTEP